MSVVVARRVGRVRLRGLGQAPLEQAATINAAAFRPLSVSVSLPSIQTSAQQAFDGAQPVQFPSPAITDEGADEQGEGLHQEFFTIDAQGEVVSETTSPVVPVEQSAAQVTDLSASLVPRGGFLKTYGPPLLLAAVLTGAVFWLRR